MLGVLILSLIISMFLFRDKRPRDRATFTVVSAVGVQFLFSVLYNILMGNALARRGYEANFEFGEFFVRWMVGAPVVGFIVWAGLWWWYQRKWIDDEADTETFE